MGYFHARTATRALSMVVEASGGVEAVRQEWHARMVLGIYTAFWHEQRETGQAADLAARAIEAGTDWSEVLRPRLDWMTARTNRSAASAVLDARWRQTVGFGDTLVDGIRPYLSVMWARGGSQMEETLGPDAWRLLFDAIGYTEVHPNGDRTRVQPAAGADKPTRSLTLYRGCAAPFKTRWSWTPDRDTAAAYATAAGRFRGDVWVATIEPERILAGIETTTLEYVVDARGMEVRHHRELLADRPYSTKPWLPAGLLSAAE